MQKDIMQKEILSRIDALSYELGVPKEKTFEAIQSALEIATERQYKQDKKEVDILVELNEKTSDCVTWRRWEIVSDDAELESPDKQMRLSEARKKQPDILVGQYITEEIDPVVSSRITTQNFKQVLRQELAAIKRHEMMESAKQYIGGTVVAVVKQVIRRTGEVIFSLGGGIEGLMLPEESIQREPFKVNDAKRVYVYELRQMARGPHVLVSRKKPELLIESFKIEIPEVGEEVIEIKSAARDPGSRAKIAVKTNDGRIDPIGACVGMRGSRVQAVSNELAGERVDIILWDDNPVQFVINAMAPAEIVSIVVDEDLHSMDLAVHEEQLSQAIGRNGQNIRLASELTGWKLNVMTEVDMNKKTQEEVASVTDLFMQKLDVDQDVADVLVEEGFTGLEEIAYISKEELSKVEGFDDNIVLELQQRAKDALLVEEIASEERLSEISIADDLLGLDNMTEPLARQLTLAGIITRDDLAEYSIDDLTEVVEIDDELAGKLILAARAHWFDKA